MTSTYYCTTAWLIDDEEISVFYTKNLLKINQFSSEVRSFFNAHEALAELESLVGSEEFPEFIFLDLNMPTLNGWDFLHAYHELPKEATKKCTLYILSSSVDENDIKRSKIHENVRDFLSKPLEKMDLEVIKFQTAKF
jgi:CheY-like chemotaxis protein